ncbi:MAG: sodium ion-translocating decarboxylase subunit beta [Oscillospiraceae bacterium]|nr:sodium ion-translocating decarboxylase subunit beta [Oscillospiraceae bacterium]
MTEAEKKMKRYTNAVERRLNLPREVKARVMSDFISSIQARREAGMSDEEIFAELGAPKKAAADVNEQMKEFAYRKSPWRFLFAALAAYGAWKLLPGVWVNLVYLGVMLWTRFGETPRMAGISTTEASSVGIIGGADGPTAVFVTTPGWMHCILPVLALAVGIFGYLRLRKCRQK